MSCKRHHLPIGGRTLQARSEQEGGDNLGTRVHLLLFTFCLQGRFVAVRFHRLSLLASVVVTIGGCALFPNGIGWLGKRLKFSQGAVGSIFPTIGTTLPETSLPIIAICFGNAQEQAEVGPDAILGAPFRLGTVVRPKLALLLLTNARWASARCSFVSAPAWGSVRVLCRRGCSRSSPGSD